MNTGIGACLLALSLAILPALAIAAEPPRECRVGSLKPVTPATAGFSVSPADENVILFSKPVDGVTQAFRLDRRTGKETCLSCKEKPGGPRIDRHKGSPAILDDGQHVLLQVEMAKHPFEGQIGAPGLGWFNDIWMTTMDGERWWNLTHYPDGPRDRFGALIPEPSPDGKRIAWAELYADDGAAARQAMKKGRSVPGGAPWGSWRIRIADIAWDSTGKPVLTRLRTITLPDASWYETQGWSRDGGFLIFASDAGQATPQAMDLWIHNLRTGRSANLTRTRDAWEEFGDIAPGGRLIAFMSSSCCPFKPTDDKKKLRSELYLTTPRRSFTERLTFFNKPGHPQGKDGPGGSIVTKLRWSRDGSKIWFERPFYGPFGGARGSYLMELTFAGRCGSAPIADP